jgi:hypothetical protein
MSSVQDSKEYLSKLIELDNDDKWVNEIAPACAFFEYAPEYLRSNFLDLRKNAQDPPDFYLALKKDNFINLEVTVMLYEIIPRTNKFFKRLEDIALPLIRKHKNLLPPGVYTITPFSDKGPLSGIKLEEVLEKDIPEWFRRYAEDGSRDHYIINDGGDRIGKLTISKLCEAKKTRISMWQQVIRLENKWTLKDLEDRLQKIVNKKENKYINKHKGIWWLLISDRGNLMNTTDLDFDTSDISLKVKFFEKIFLIRYENRVNELNVYSS